MNPDERRFTFDSTAGGVMTVETGAITGELELSTRPDEGNLEVFVRYAGAEEWYTVKGGPISSSEEIDPGELHECIVAHLSHPGRRISGNEEPVSLASFPENS